MTPEERERMDRICRQIQIEKDPQVFDRLVEELNDLLELKHARIHPEHQTSSPKTLN
jgi:hypothetical protein